MSQAVYRNEQHAIIRAMAVDSIPSCKPAQWQTQYSSGYVEDLTKLHTETESLSANDRLTQDSMTRARIHRNTSQSAFYAVVAKYGADEQERANAVHSNILLLLYRHREAQRSPQRRVKIMDTFNIVTTQDKELFEVIFAALTDHHEQPHEFVVESPVVAVKAVFYTWMEAQKAIDAFDPDDMNLDLKAVGEWIANLADYNDYNDMY